MDAVPEPQAVSPPPPTPRASEIHLRAPRALRSALLRPAWVEPGLRTALRAFAGFVFLYLGALKISAKTFEHSVLGTRGLDLAPGPGGFAQYLAAAGIPLPEVSAYLCVTVELLCGLGIILGAFLPLAQLVTRLFAVALAVDMLTALAVTGVRNIIGHPVLRPAPFISEKLRILTRRPQLRWA